MNMTAQALIEKYYPADDDLRRLLRLHSRMVADKAIAIATSLPEELRLQVDFDFLQEAAMLHDIGIFRCHAPSIYCNGDLPYICHGVEGRKILDSEGLPRHALVCERHTGSGLTAKEIQAAGWPIPVRDMLPISLEEKIICYADKFFSKSGNPRREKPIEEVRASMARHGEGPLLRFDRLTKLLSPA